MQFSEIPGHTELKAQLIHAQQRAKIAHAQLFSGIRGSSVLPLALGYASYLMCNTPTPADSCGSCPNCVRIKKFIHPDLHFVFPKISAAEDNYEKVHAEALPLFRSFLTENPFGNLNDWINFYGNENKKLLISRDDSRHILRNVSMRSVEGGYKILVIWCPETMNPGSANAILKVLEEPPEKTLYLLVTYNYEVLLTTITSRSQLVNVALNSDQEVTDFLVAKGFDEQKAKQTAGQTEGKIGLALSHIEDSKESQFQDFQLWMRDCWAGNFQSIIARAEDFHKLGKVGQQSSLEFYMTLVHKCILQACGVDQAFESDAEGFFVIKFTKNMGEEKLAHVYHLLNETITHLNREANARISHTNLSLDIFKTINEAG